MTSTNTTFSVMEAANELGISDRRVRQMIGEGRFVPEFDGLGHARLTRTQVAAELKRRGRQSVRGLPSLPGATKESVDPLLSRLDTQNDLLQEILATIEKTVGAAVRLLEGIGANQQNINQSLMASQNALIGLIAPNGSAPARKRAATRT